MMKVISRVKAILDEHFVEGYLAGGTVRDSVMGRDSDDIDIVVGASAFDVGRAVADALDGRFVPLDRDNDIARVVLPAEGRLHIDIAGMRGQISTDLGLRDFTMDAMAVALGDVVDSQMEIIDPYGGRKDIDNCIVRSVAEEAFRQDPARLLRAVRLAAEFDFALDAETEAQIKRNQHLIARVSGERVRDELCRIISVPKAAKWLRVLDDLGLLMSIFPELAPARGVEQPKEHCWDVLQHSFETVAAVEFLLHIESSDYFGDEHLSLAPWSPALEEHFRAEISGGRSRATLLKLAGILHDIAKPQTKMFEESGRMRFFGHSQEGAEIVSNIMERLRFSSRERDMVCTMVEQHLRPGQLARDGEMPTRRAMYRYFRDVGDVAIDIIFLNLADHLAARGVTMEYDKWREHADTLRYVIDERFAGESIVKPEKLIDGNDIIDKYGLTPGPQIGMILEAVREAQASGEIATREEALHFVGRYLGSQT